ncbi:hypothetical protein [Tautonia marina]|uniref:hypothetical protein n=1 Tax=Tautonia marina TaxID=2653855 RepID=UPI001260ED79|nr:hypothetical protein [Tautonia marina]
MTGLSSWSRLSLSLCVAIPVLGLGIWPSASILLEPTEANPRPDIVEPTDNEGCVPSSAVYSISPQDWAIPNGNTTWSWLNSCGCLQVLE